MKELIFGLSVALVGMGVVFVGLVILIGSIKLISLASTERKPKDDAVSEMANADADAPAAVTDGTQGVPADVLAAITAAIAAVWQGDAGFTVRRVRRIHNAPAWNRAGRDDQIYSRM